MKNEKEIRLTKEEFELETKDLPDGLLERYLSFATIDGDEYVFNTANKMFTDFRSFIQHLIYKESPSIVTLLKSIGKSATDIAKTALTKGRIILSADDSKKRLDICSGCEYVKIKDKNYICGECHCNMSMKVKFAGAVCPKGKWDKNE